MTVSENQKFEFPDELFMEAEFDRLVAFSKKLDDTAAQGGSSLGNNFSGELLPQSFGNYELTRIIGQGKTGRVYLANQSGARQTIAVKKIHSKFFANRGCVTIDELMKRFRKESRAAAVVDHNNVVAIYDIGEVDGQYFYSMKYVEGKCLSKLILANTFSNREAAETVKTIADGVHQLHRAGIFHREISPSNIILDSNRQPHILDLGLSMLRADDPGDLPEELGFMAPEFASNRSSIDAAAEVWSLGAILYNCLVGEPPFSNRNDKTVVLKRLLNEDPEAPQRRNSSVAKDLETICLKCLRKNPANRYESAASLAEDLGRFIDYQPIHAAAPSLLERSWKKLLRVPI